MSVTTSAARGGYQGIIHRYREYMPVSEATPVVTLNEGNTPLIPCPRISAMVGERVDLRVKFEGLNPTASFKDRGMTMAVSKGLEEGATSVMCASTGNTSASAAAYAARAGIQCAVILPEGAIAMGKLAQALMHGAKVIAIRGNFDDALNIVREVTDKYPVLLVNSINPFRIEGQKSGAFEICDTWGRQPTFHAIPVGNAGNITAYWKGYKEYHAAGVISCRPVMLGFQAAGAAPIVLGHKVDKPETLATAIRIGNPASWKQAEAARDESGGLIDMVTDEEILEAYHLLAHLEGLLVEPASAASVAGVLKLTRSGFFKDKHEYETDGILRIACVLTGHGLKDPTRAIDESPEPLRCGNDIKEVLRLLELA